MAWLPAVLVLLAGCAGSGQMVSLDVVPKLPPAQALASDPVKIVIEPFEDRRADQGKLGYRTHLGGGVTYFNVAGGKVGDTAAETMAETLRQQGWQRRGWDARVVQTGVAVSGADILVTGEVLELTAHAKSRFFSTVITTECRMLIKASNLKDGSVTTNTLTSAAFARSITVFGATVSPTGKPSVTTSTARLIRRFSRVRGALLTSSRIASSTAS